MKIKLNIEAFIDVTSEENESIVEIMKRVDQHLRSFLNVGISNTLYDQVKVDEILIIDCATLTSI